MWVFLKLKEAFQVSTIVSKVLSSCSLFWAQMSRASIFIKQDPRLMALHPHGRALPPPYSIPRALQILKQSHMHRDTQGEENRGQVPTESPEIPQPAPNLQQCQPQGQPAATALLGPGRSPELPQTTTVYSPVYLYWVQHYYHYCNF